MQKSSLRLLAGALVAAASLEPVGALGGTDEKAREGAAAASLRNALAKKRGALRAGKSAARPLSAPRAPGQDIRRFTPRRAM